MSKASLQIFIFIFLTLNCNLQNWIHTLLCTVFEITLNSTKLPKSYDNMSRGFFIRSVKQLGEEREKGNRKVKAYNEASSVSSIRWGALRMFDLPKFFNGRNHNRRDSRILSLLAVVNIITRSTQYQKQCFLWVDKKTYCHLFLHSSVFFLSACPFDRHFF